MRGQRLSANRSLFPPDDRAARRHADDAKRDFGAAAIDGEAGQCAQRAFERERRGSDDAVPAQTELSDGETDQQPLRRTGAAPEMSTPPRATRKTAGP